MSASIAVGELVPLLRRIVATLGVVVLCVGGVTIGLAVTRHRSIRRAAALRPGIRADLVERLPDDDPGWDGWIERLSSHERELALELAEGLLRKVRGAERTKLQRLVRELGIDDRRLRADVEFGDPPAQRRALAWLALLDHRLPPEVFLEHAVRPRSVRTAAARALYQAGDPVALRAATRLLVRDGTEPLSLFGVDTLYRLATDQPDYLLDLARDDADEWDVGFLIQVISVVRLCVSVVPPSAVAWIAKYATHDSTEARTAAILALSEYVWHPAIRGRLDFRKLVDDPAPEVRSATYVALDSCAAPAMEELLVAAACNEDDDRARLIAVRLLRDRDDEPFDFAERTERPDPAVARTVAWVDAETRDRPVVRRRLEER